jgi:hypothetical protein
MEAELTYRNRVWWFGLIVTAMLIAAITTLVSDIINDTPDDSWKTNPLIYQM